MKENILKIADYIESLEQRIAALETRVSDMEALQVRVTALELRVLELEQQPQTQVVEADPDPEKRELSIEGMLPIVEEEPIAPPIIEEPVLVEEMPAPVVEAPAPAPVVVEEPTPTPVEEEPVPIIMEEEPTPAPVVEEPIPVPVEEVKMTAASSPTQTSLFGAPVQDIRKAISLGDRFLFQRELFNGSAEKMQKTLDAINAMSSLEQAQQYVEANFNWNTESSTYDLFMNVLRRRF